MAVLTKEQYQELRAKVVGVAEEALVAREVISPLNVDVGTQEYGYDKMTDMSPAEFISKYATGSRDMIDLSRNVKNIEIMHKGFKVSRIDMLSSQKSGSSLRAVGLARATRLVANLEDTSIINGNTTFSVNGIATIAENTMAGGQAWSTAPTENLNPYQDVLDAQTMLGADGHELKFIILNTTNWGEACKKIPGSEGIWMNMIKKIVPKVLKTTAVPEGTFVGGDMGEDIAQLIIAEDYEILDANVDGQMVYDFDVINRVLPMFYEYGDTTNKSEAFIKVTGI